MADQNRRAGCGCLPLVALLIAGSLVVGGLDQAGTGWGRVVASTSLAVLAAAIVVGAIVQRRRQTSASTDDGSPTPTTPVAAKARPAPASPSTPMPARSRSRDLRTGPRDLVTQADDPDTDRLRSHLVEAVADLADKTESMVSGTEQGPPRRLTSEEMIARAKQRIAEMGHDRTSPPAG